MKLLSPTSEVYAPDGVAVDHALARTTHLGIGAHHDDLEIMAIDGILTCYEREDAWFTGVVVTDGRGSPRSGEFAQYTDDEMAAARIREQKDAAALGKYSAVIMLGRASEDVKIPGTARQKIVGDLVQILKTTRPRVVYTHNLADKHDTHVAVALAVIEAARALPSAERPEALYGGEVWRDLDWLPDERKIVFDCSAHLDLQEALLRCFRSQIAGGKRYDLAATGRRRAHATYLNSHRVDRISAAAYAVDLTPLIRDGALSPVAFVTDLTRTFAEDVRERLLRAGAT